MAAPSNDPIIGHTIVGARHLTAAECDEWGWDHINPHNPAPVALILSNGVIVYAVQDYEGNGPGALFLNQGGETYSVDILPEETQGA